MDKVEKGFISAAATIATSQQPAAATVTFTHLLGMPMPDVQAILAQVVPVEQTAGPAEPGQPDDSISQPQAAMPQQSHGIPPDPAASIPGT
jgi:hypothetical protein